MDPIVTTLDKALYWELRTRTTEHQHLVEDAEAKIHASQARIAELLTEAGLDPKAHFRLDDATCAATTLPAPPVP